MPIDQAMGLVMRLLTQAQALAAITARARLIELDTRGDAAVHAQLDRVAACLDADDAFRDLTPDERAIVISFVRSYLRQALELVEDPARPTGWVHTDPVVLDAQGRASGVIATLVARAGLGRPDARILDIGTGVAGLAIALCKQFPQCTVVGLDPWAPALALARANVDAAGLSSRITLREGTIQSFTDSGGGFDLVWLPSFFIPLGVLDDAMRRAFAVMRSGAEIVVGAFVGPDDALGAAVDELMTVRAGGSVLAPTEAVARLTRVGFSGATVVPRRWHAPVHLITARRD